MLIYSGRTAVRTEGPGIGVGVATPARRRVRAIGIVRVDAGATGESVIAGEDAGRAAPRAARGAGRVPRAAVLSTGTSIEIFKAEGSEEEESR